MINRLYYFGLLGDMKKLPVGGGQTSARRVVEGLRAEGFEVITTDRHWNTRLSRVGHLIETSSYAVWNVTQLFFRLLFGRRKNSAYINLSYSNVLLPLEYYTGMMAKILGYKSILYLKGGRLEAVIAKLEGKRKEMFKKNLDIRSLVFVEGESDIARLKEFTDTPVLHFPNYIFEKNIPEAKPVKPLDEIGICHFGRITPYKKVDVVLDSFEMLADKYKNLHLYIIGGIGGVGGGNQQFYDMIDKRCKESKFADRIVRKGQSSSGYLREVMDKCQFFLFPTADPCEGQSNSLNEAMTQGLIPIVSDFHFNRAIVGNNKLVVDGYDPHNYAKVISDIIDKNQVEELSEEAWMRIKNYFAYNVVNKRISDEIRNI